MNIWYDSTQLRQEFLTLLEEFATAIRTERICDTIGKDLLKTVNTQINQISTRLQAEFSLVVIGDFKRGKSTLINALLQQNIVTTDVTTETVTINQIRYSSTHQIYACLTNGGRTKLEPENLKREQLEPLLKQLPHPLDRIVIETPIEWLKGLQLVDTPGTGDILEQFNLQVHNYLLQADAAIVVISALAPLAESERSFLRLSVLPQDFPKVYFVLNLLDYIRTEAEAKRLLNSTQRKINQLFPSTTLHGLSALDELCRLQEQPRPNSEQADTLAANFETFRQCLQDSIVLNRDVIQLDRATDHFTQTLAEFEKNLMLLEQAMQTDQQQLNQAIAQCQDQTSALFKKIEQHKTTMRSEIEQMSEVACSWMSEFLLRLETEAVQKLTRFRLDEIRRHFHFFLADSSYKATQQCISAHQAALLKSSDKAQQAIAEDVQLLTVFDSVKTDIAKATFHDQLWTSLDTLQLLASYTPFKVATNFLTKQTKRWGQAKQVAMYQQQLKQAFPALKQSVLQEVRSIYAGFAAELAQRVDNHYQQELEAKLSAMEQAKVLYSNREIRSNVTHEGLEAALSLVRDTQAHLETLKQKLWADASPQPSEFNGTETG